MEQHKDQKITNGLSLNVKVFHRGYSRIIPDVIILLVLSLGLCNSECGFCCQAWQLAATQLSQLR